VKEKYLFELGGENIELGRYEAIELLEYENYRPQILSQEINLLVIEVAKPIEKRIMRRFGMVKRISNIINYLKYIEINEVIKKIPDIDIKNKSFAIRLLKKNGESESKVAKLLGEKISHKNKIDLNNPDVKIFYYSGENTIISIWDKNMETYYSKCLKHHIKHRPYFSPISIHPRIARSMVNLARCPLQGKIIDPFCGTGGILIEIADIGIDAIGIDILDKMKEYSLGNLKHYNLSAKVLCGDIEIIKYYNFNAIVTDPPYGISTTTKGEGIDKLMKRSLDLFANKLKSKQRLVIAVSKPEIIDQDSLKIVKCFEWYIHKSLTRYIMIIEKI
tara:strand:+ start:163 stop:1158 length:996 start_codon:yes stop_codon:yes gene_type:complete